MIQQVDNKHSEKEFEIGQWVFLIATISSSLASSTPFSETRKEIYGSFRIIHRIEPMTYELELPGRARIHPIFHTSLLKPCHGHPSSQVLPLPPHTTSTTADPTPIATVQCRQVPSNTGGKIEILVQWKEQDIEEATWELEDSFLRQYPNVDLEDKTHSGLGPGW